MLWLASIPKSKAENWVKVTDFSVSHANRDWKLLGYPLPCLFLQIKIFSELLINLTFLFTLYFWVPFFFLHMYVICNHIVLTNINGMELLTVISCKAMLFGPSASQHIFNKYSQTLKATFHFLLSITINILASCTAAGEAVFKKDLFSELMMRGYWLLLIKKNSRPIWKKNLKMNEYMHMYYWFTLLYIWNVHNFLSHQESNNLYFKKRTNYFLRHKKSKKKTVIVIISELLL